MIETGEESVGRIMGIATQFWQSQQLYVTTRLNIADVLADGPLTAAEIAETVGADPQMLHRLVRALAPLGIFATDSDGRIRNTPLSEVLRKDHPSRAHQFVQFEVSPAYWQAFTALEHTVRTGENAFEKVHGCSFFSFLGNDTELEGHFADTMSAMAKPQASAIAQAYPFSNHATIVDVGGSNGDLIAEIVRAAPGSRGILFDLPSVVERSRDEGPIAAPDISSRITTAAGSALEGVPAGHTCYIIKNVIHDWDDATSIAILSNIGRDMAPAAKVLVAEFVVPAGDGPDWSKQLDIAVLVGNNGQERTEKEYAALFAAAGLQLEAVHPTACGISILEAVRACA